MAAQTKSPGAPQSEPAKSEPAKAHKRQNLNDAIAEELSNAEQTMPSPLLTDGKLLLGTNPDFDSPDAFALPEPPDDFSMGTETRVVNMTPDMQRALEAGITLGADKLEAVPPTLDATLDFGDRQIPVKKPLLILGRVKEVSDVALSEDDQVSRHHAAITFVRGEFFIEDLKSTNGTFLDGKRIKRTRLPQDVPVRVGSTTFTLRVRR